MANEEHLAILKEGVDVWNAWREENKSSIVDLSRSNLNGFDLGKIDLSFVNLSESNLKKTILRHLPHHQLLP